MKEKLLNKPKIIHVMADGSIRDSIEGHIIPAGHIIYDYFLGLQESIYQRTANRSRKGA